jgi:hypothetical protein
LDNRLAPTLSLAPAYGTSDRLDPGQHMTHALEMEFPAEALCAFGVQAGDAQLPGVHRWQ